MVERISADMLPREHGHRARYEWAAEYLQDGDRVFDVACGIGYGGSIMSNAKKIEYIGADKIEPDISFSDIGLFYSNLDLDFWVPDFEWDVSVCFETLEHVKNPKHLAEQVSKAKRLLIVSVPTRPTKHFNEFHLHDFTVEDILELFAGHELIELRDQPEELSHFFVFGPKDA